MLFKGHMHRAACFLFVLVLSACGGGSGTEEAPSGQTSTAIPPTTAALGPDTTPSTTAALGPDTTPSTTAALGPDTTPSTTAALGPDTTPSTTAAPGTETRLPATTEPEVAPVMAAAPAVLSPQEVYSLVAPSIPLIETPAGKGSGILIEGGYVVTNHHVVWPYHKVWMAFPDGTELGDVPVLGWNPVADLAVLGPVGVPAPPLSLVDGEGMDPGSEVYLIGYSAEADLIPQLTITSGVLSRFVEWDLYALTLLESDAVVAVGQSGGALVNSSGDVVGISTWGLGDAWFTVATSAADSAEIVRSMLLDHEQLGPPGPVYGDDIGAFEFAVELANAWDVGLYSFEGAAGSTIEVAIGGPSDGLLAVVGPTGVVMKADDTFEGREYGIVELPVDGPYLVVVANYSAESGEESVFALTSSVKLSPFDDNDDGQSLGIGQRYGGVIDYQGDTDWYELPLEQGDTVVVWTEAVGTHTAVHIGYEFAGLEEVVRDDGSGPAAVGGSTNARLHYNARLYYRAPISGTYHLVVADAWGQNGGAYFVRVARADPSEAPVAGKSPSGTGSPEDPDFPVDYLYDLRFDVGPGTTWRELFDVFEPAEQGCIRQEFGGGLLEDVLAAEVLGEGNEDEFAGMLLCLGQENATEAYISALVGDFARRGATFELDVACLREVFAGDGGAAFLTSLITRGIEEDSGALVLPFLSCFPEEAFEEPADP